MYFACFMISLGAGGIIATETARGRRMYKQSRWGRQRLSYYGQTPANTSAGYIVCLSLNHLCTVRRRYCLRDESWHSDTTGYPKISTKRAQCCARWNLDHRAFFCKSQICVFDIFAIKSPWLTFISTVSHQITFQYLSLRFQI